MWAGAFAIFLPTHNEAPLESWIELEYTENIRYGESTVAFSPWMQALKAELNADSARKIAEEGEKLENCP